MRRLRDFLLGIALLCLLVPAVNGQDASFYTQLTVGTTAATIGSGLTNETTCRGTLENAAIRVIWTGGTPTASVGQPMAVGERILLGTRSDVSNFKAITADPGGLSGVLNLTCAKAATTEVSRIETPATAVPTLPVCNPLLRAAGRPCR